MNDKHLELLADLGGSEYLEALTKIKDDGENVDYYASRQRALFTRSRYLEYAEKLYADMTHQELDNKDVDDIVGSVEEEILDIANQMATDSEVYKFGDEAQEKLERRAEDPSQILGLATGFTEFDRYTNGLRPGDLVFICARAKMGKSTLLQNMATNIAVGESNGENVPVLYIDTEMDKDLQEDRILAKLTGIPIKEIENGMFALDTEVGKAKDKMAKVKTAIELLSSNHFYHIYMPDFTVNKVENLARQYQLRHDIGLIVFDYIKIPASDKGSLRNTQEYQALGFMASGLKDIAGKLEIPILSATQENRSDINSNKKDASNVGGSDRILQLATKLCFLYDKDKATIHEEGIQNGNQELYIAYQRNGSSDCPPIDIMFDRNCLRMEEV